nr:helix-turn-helix domain-containing protein [Streptomonospora mangrovi]
MRKERCPDQLKRDDNRQRSPYPTAPAPATDKPGSGPHLPEVYTPAEAAQVLKVPESWLRKKATQQAIPCTFIGKHLRFSAADLVRIVQQGARRPVTGRAANGNE